MTEDEYYISFAATREFCLANGLSQFETINSLSGIKKPVDLCYSFAAIGFHWSIRLYLDKLIPFLASGAHLILELKAPLSSLSKTIKGTPEEYRRFYNEQIDFAQKHTGYELAFVQNLKNYTGRIYKEPSHFLVLRKLAPNE